MSRLVFDQSSPVEPVSESRGGGLSVTGGEGQTDILVSNIGCNGTVARRIKYMAIAGQKTTFIH